MKTMFGFKCSRCGKCCQNFSEDVGVLLFPDDISNISRELGIACNFFIKKYTYKRILKFDNKTLELAYIAHRNGKCIFLNENMLCEIHSVKPVQCRESPINFFWGISSEQNCVQKLEVPIDHSTEEQDIVLVKTLINSVGVK